MLTDQKSETCGHGLSRKYFLRNYTRVNDLNYRQGSTSILSGVIGAFPVVGTQTNFL